MICIVTECEKCYHEKVCKYANNAKNAMNKFKNTLYGDGYTWKDKLLTLNVEVKFSCPDFILKTQPFTR